MVQEIYSSLTAPKRSTWNEEEIKCLLEVWTADYTREQSEQTNKNQDKFTTFSQRMSEKGFQSTAKQCHIHVKRQS